MKTAAGLEFAYGSLISAQSANKLRSEIGTRPPRIIWLPLRLLLAGKLLSWSFAKSQYRSAPSCAQAMATHARGWPTRHNKAGHHKPAVCPDTSAQDRAGNRPVINAAIGRERCFDGRQWDDWVSRRLMALARKGPVTRLGWISTEANSPNIGDGQGIYRT